MADYTIGGNDRLVSGFEVTDHMWGDAEIMSADAKGGADQFAFAPGNGADIVYDFEVGKDKIDLSAFSEITASDLDTLLNVDFTNNRSVLTLGVDDTVTLLGVTNLSARDFILWA